MLNDADPPWERLPDDPLAFFGLDPDFDRAELRRRYTRLLRRFRPERAPEQFQLLRAAFEELETRLRMQADAPERAVDPERNPEPTPQRPPAAAGSPVVPRSVPPPRRCDDPREELSLLRSQPEKSVDGWLRQAVLSYVLEPAVGPNPFAATLVEGLRQHPGAPALTQPLDAHCQTPAAVCEATTLLPLLATLRDPRAFVDRTRSIWEACRSQLAWPELEALFDRCIQSFDDPLHPAFAELRVLVLRVGTFAADERWLEGQWRDLLDGVRRRGVEADDELRREELWREYGRARHTLANGTAVPAAIDRTLHALARGERAQADQLFTELRQRMMESPDEVLAAFPFPGTAAHEATCSLLELLRPEAARSSPAPPRAFARIRVQQLVVRLTELASRSAAGGLLHTFAFGPRLLAAAVLVPGLLVGGGTKSLLLGVAASAGMTLALVWGYPRIRRRVDRLSERLFCHLHRNLWRREIARFVVEAGIGCRSLHAWLPTVDGEHFIALLEKDHGLAILSLAVPD
ncbi:MAG: hypothetical protein KDC87_18720 [Planctomycetes bacterium]|nr:hypothetical protein [Planctomycetota bacterium]MCB9869768.1 hypothetical protein [Planctomycetota bacterium]MCB9872379.1 hypothetical protein [Planctomycetota bacterium]